jgi:hypothetical protein
MQKTEKVIDLNKEFDKYLARHNEDRHTMRQAWMDGARWMAKHLADTIYAMATEGASKADMENEIWRGTLYNASGYIIAESSSLMEKANASK